MRSKKHLLCLFSLAHTMLFTTCKKHYISRRESEVQWRFTEILRLEETFGDHLVQAPCLDQGQLEQVVQDHVQSCLWILSKDGHSITTLNSFFQCLATVTLNFSYA